MSQSHENGSLFQGSSKRVATLQRRTQQELALEQLEVCSWELEEERRRNNCSAYPSLSTLNDCDIKPGFEGIWLAL